MNTFGQENQESLQNIKENELVQLSFYGEWTFTEGSPTPGWEKKRQPGVSFFLDACINLDLLCKRQPIPNESEGVLYARMTALKDGIALLGFGADWCMKVHCNGILVLDTYSEGNGRKLVMINNHRVFLPVKAGDNLIAIRVRRGEKTWNFASGGVSSLLPPQEPAVTYGPWISNLDTDGATINFVCNQDLGCGIRYRIAGESEWKLKWDTSHCQILRRTFHILDLTGFAPGTDVEYQIVCIHPDIYEEMPVGNQHVLHIPDEQTSRFSMFFTADLQFGLEVQLQYLDVMLKASNGANCDLFVLGGDINSSFKPTDTVAGPIQRLQECGIDGKGLVYVRGNHELRGPNGDRFLEYFANREGQTYGIFRYGDTAFLVLDSWEDKPAETPGHSYCKWNLDEDFIHQEAEWLASALTSDKWTGATRHVVICHGAPYSHHDSCHTIPFRMQKMTDQYFRGRLPAMPINLWLAGHVHRYMRSIPGTDEIAATHEPAVPFEDGKDYAYPVLTVAGPSKICPEKASCFRIDFEPDGMLIQSWNHEGKLLEKIRLENNGTCTELVSLPHFSRPANPLDTF